MGRSQISGKQKGDSSNPPKNRHAGSRERSGARLQSRCWPARANAQVRALRMHEADRATTYMTSPATTSSLPGLQVSVRDDHMQGDDYRSEPYVRSHVGWNHRPSLGCPAVGDCSAALRVFPLAPFFIMQLASWKRARQVVPGPDQTTGRRKATVTIRCRTCNLRTHRVLITRRRGKVSSVWRMYENINASAFLDFAS